MTAADDTPEEVVESARRDVQMAGRQLVLDRLGPSASAIAEETALRLLAHFDRLMATAAPLLVLSKGTDSQRIYAMALAMLEVSLQVAVASLGQGIDAARFRSPEATFQ